MIVTCAEAAIKVLHKAEELDNKFVKVSHDTISTHTGASAVGSGSGIFFFYHKMRTN